MNGQNAGNGLHPQQIQAIQNMMQSTGMDMPSVMDALRRNPQLLHQQAAQLPASAIMGFQQQPQMPQHSPTYAQFPGGQSAQAGPFPHPGMVPMTGQLNPALPQGSPTNPTGFMGQNPNLQNALSGMDPGTLARQMQALNDASRVRANHQNGQPGAMGSRPASGGNAGFPPQGMMASQMANAGMQGPQPGMLPPGVTPQQAQQIIQAQQNSNRQIQANFYKGLQNVHKALNNPLPPAIFGAFPQAYEWTHSKWKNLQVGSRPGTVMLEGVEIDLWKLYALIFRMGGLRASAKNEEAWSRFATQFGLPAQVTTVTEAGPITQTGSQVLRNFYEQLLEPVEKTPYQQQQLQRLLQQHQTVTAAAAGQQGVDGLGAQASGVPMAASLHARNPSQSLPDTLKDDEAMKVKALMDSNAAFLQNAQFAQPQASQVNGHGGQGSPSNVAPPNFNLTLPTHLQRPGMKQEPSREALGMQQLNNAAGAQFSNDAERVSPARGGGEEDGKKRKRDSEAPDDDARKKAKSEGTPVANTPAEDERTSPVSAGVGPSGGPGSAVNGDAAAGLHGDALLNGHGPVNGIPSAFADPSAAANPALAQPRRKIEYIPWRKDFELPGGRSIAVMDSELMAQKSRRGLRDLSEFGSIDIERVTMCLRSGLSLELSYGLTVLSFLSMLDKVPALPDGFLLQRADDLTTVLLDLLEETAFGDAEDRIDAIFMKNASAAVMAEKLVTHHELCRKVSEVEILPLPSDPITGEDEADKDPLAKPSAIITVLLNIFRNLTVIPANASFLASQTRFLELLMKVSGFEDAVNFKPLSPFLELADLIDVRKSVMHILGNVGSDVRLAALSLPVAHAIYALEASFVVDTVNAVGPVKASVQHLFPRQGQPHPDIYYKPPTTADHALEGLSRIMIPDDNRAVISSFSQSQLWTLFDALVRMLPMTDHDFQLFRFNNHHDWLSYSERVSLCLYSVTYLAPPTLKARMRKDISYRNLLHRLIEKLVRSSPDWEKNPFSVLCRRMVETLGIIVDRQDNFTTSKMLPFGTKEDSAYGEKSDDETPGVFLRDELLWNFSHVKGVDETVIVEVSRWASEGNKGK